MLRAKGVVGKFVEFYGPGLAHLSLADRATIANMAPEYGATCGFFPVDAETIAYLRATGRGAARAALVEAYAKAQGLWRHAGSPDPIFTSTLELDIGTVQPSLAGPRRPQDRVPLSTAAGAFAEQLKTTFGKQNGSGRFEVAGANHELRHGDVVIAAITSCTNTSNPAVMVAAGLLARKAVARGLKVKPWVKTSLAPGSKVVSDYLAQADLQAGLDKLGFNLVGYGCTTCIGNSGPLAEPLVNAIAKQDLVVCSVLSGNRNFEGRISPHIRANYLASPPLVVAYALAGSMTRDLNNEPLGKDAKGKPVYLKEIWPSNKEIHDTMRRAVRPAMFRRQYADVFTGDARWRRIKTAPGLTYRWDAKSTYVKHPPFFAGMTAKPEAVGDISGARVLALLGDSITTDHISPAGSIARDGDAGKYLIGKRVAIADFNSFGARRGNHEVMMRGTFGNIRLRNEMVPGSEGGVTRLMPGGKRMSIYDAAMRYRKQGVPLVVVAGKEYGTGSSRDWAAKGTNLLGVAAVIAESYERIHRSNLVGMGVLPLTFKDGMTRKSLRLDGSERFDLMGLGNGLKPGMAVPCRITRADGKSRAIELLCRIDTEDEVEYYRHGGILHYVLRNLLTAAGP
jgi:aconitate hydratase